MNERDLMNIENALWQFWVVTVSKRQSAVVPREHHRFPPTVLDSFRGQNDMSWCNIVPAWWERRGRVGRFGIPDMAAAGRANLVVKLALDERDEGPALRVDASRRQLLGQLGHFVRVGVVDLLD